MKRLNEEIVHDIQCGISVNENLALLYEQNRPIWAQIVRGVYSGEQDREDGMQEAYFALSLAVDRYDAEKGYKFITFLSAVARGYLIRRRFQMGDRGGISYGENELANKIRKFEARYYAERGSSPAAETVQKYFGITSGAYINAKKAELFHARESIDRDIAIGKNADRVSLAEILPGNTNLENKILDEVERQEIKRLLSDAFDALSSDERTIIELRYYKGFTMEKCGAVCGLSAIGARTRCESALRKLRRSVPLRRYAEAAGYVRHHERSCARRANKAFHE